MELRDLGWVAKDQWGRVRYFWVATNQSYGTWYHLECERKGLRSEVKVASGKGAEVTVQPDMDPGRWYWAVRIGLTKKTKEPVQWGSKSTAEEAIVAAKEAFMNGGSGAGEEISQETTWT